MKKCLKSDWLPRYSCLNVQIQGVVNGNKEREVSFNVILIVIYCSNNKFVTHKSQICYSPQ